MSSFIETLSTYVPALVTWRLAENPAPLKSPITERFPVAILFADISGFTLLAERGPAGDALVAQETLVEYQALEESPLALRVGIGVGELASVDVKHLAQKPLTALTQVLPPTAMEAATQRGRALDLDGAVAQAMA